MQCELGTGSGLPYNVFLLGGGGGGGGGGMYFTLLFGLTSVLRTNMQKSTQVGIRKFSSVEDPSWMCAEEGEVVGCLSQTNPRLYPSIPI